MNEKTREHRGGRIRENVMQVVFLIAACISILAVALICIYPVSYTHLTLPTT